MPISFSEFSLFTEELHPELQKIVQAPSTLHGTPKQTRISKKIRELSLRGEETGIEGNMPKGSSRAYIQHKEELPINVDGKIYHVKTGTKIAIRHPLDKHFDREKWGHASHGHMHNNHENNDSFVDREYRILTENDDGSYSHNPSGIFPPKFDHDYDNDEWSHIGHAENINNKKFKELTKNEDYPNGIEHKHFLGALIRSFDNIHGKYHPDTPENEKKLDHAENHPLTQSFLDHQNTYSASPHDYNIRNMGAFKVGNKEHIVARDHGFGNDVMRAYADSRKRASSGKRGY